MTPPVRIERERGDICHTHTCKGEVGKAFAWFYTAVIGVRGLAPIGCGARADCSSITTSVLATALTAAAIVPMVLALRPNLREGWTRQSV